MHHSVNHHCPEGVTKIHFSADRSLMIQGTTSDAGKSAFATALCRLLSNIGRHVAPFKPQNMALNSAVTQDGGEIGRAQAVQAQGARVEPIVAFNPILLKPDSDIGSQVIVNGFSIGHYSAKAYQALKPRLLQQVVEQHSALLSSFDNVIIEGAGSPAEINLRQNDIANMGFAEAVDCPVILISDIDRGGVFAHLVGTLELLSESEQARVTGFIINRFRGDVSLLEPGIEWLEARTGKPVLAVVPYLENFHLEAEDGLSRGKNTSQGTFNVVVIALPRMSNHTDFDPLRLHPDISLTFAKHPVEVNAADLIIIPGSKHTREDLAWLKAQQWENEIHRHVRYGGKLLGICGGYQMLGSDILDPHGVEGTAGRSKGLGFLPITTTMAAKKQLRRVKGECLFSEDNQCESSGKQPQKRSGVEGYEIHMGESRLNASSLNRMAEEKYNRNGTNTVNYTLSPDDRHVQQQHSHPSTIGSVAQAPKSHAHSLCPAFLLEDGRYDGWISADGRIMGSYLHGLFDHPDALQALLCWAGMKSPAAFDYRQATEHEIDRLAASVQASLRPACKNVPVLADIFDDGKGS
ncbi:Cobyric acid synthase [Halomonadaceae bacterium LMG 33818]